MGGHHVSFTVTGRDQDEIEEAALGKLEGYVNDDTVDRVYLRRCLAVGTVRVYPHEEVRSMAGPIRTVWEASVEVELL